MIGGLKMSSRFASYASATLLVGAVAFTPAHAADLGGDCCADLEERVAELEATTARKGNRKVSLTVSGQVNTALLIWDDGDDTDVFIVDNENSNTRFRFKGDAKIKPGWTAGYLLELDVDGHANTSTVSQGDPEGTGGGEQDDILELRHADLFVKSPYGKVSLGQGDTASNGTSEVDLSGTSVAGYSGTTDIGSSFTFISSAGVDTGITKGSTQSNLDGLSRDNRIRYDSPTIAGFIFSASYGEDDQYDVVLRYKNKIGEFNIAGAIAYSEQDDFNAGTDLEEEQVNGSISIFHIPTGLNFTFAAGSQDDEASASAAWEQTFYYGKVGLKRKIFSAGSTAFSVDYGFYDEFGSSAHEAEHLGIQLVQKVDAAAMELYFAWSHDSLEIDGAADPEELNFFLLGSRIKF